MSVRREPWTRRPLRALAAVCLVACLGGAYLWLRGVPESPHRQYPPLLARLLSEPHLTRPIEARLAGQPRYAPYAARRRGAPSAVPSARLEVQSLVGQLAAGAGAPRDDAALAIALLVTGDASQAVQFLEASGIVATDPEWGADLAATYLARSADSADPLDAARAYEHAARLLRLRPEHGAARFNAALALERLSLVDSAARAWHDVGERDPDRDWRAEGAQRARVLADIVTRRASEAPRDRIVAALDQSNGDLARGVGEFPQVAREYFEDELLAAWGRAVLNHQRAEEARLRVAIASLARALTQTHGDTSWSRLTDTLPLVASREADVLARGFIAYGEARRLYEADEVADAARHLDVAIPILSAARSPLLGWALVHMAIVRYRASDLAGAETLAAEALRLCESQRLDTLQARVRWFLGFLAAARYDREHARAYWQQALAHFERVGEAENLATLHIQLAELADALGDVPAGWRHRQAALSALRPHFSRRRQHAILMSAARGALQQDLPHLASQLNELTLENARSWNAPGPLSQAHFYRARTLVRIGDAREALRSLDQARAATRLVDAPALAKASEAEFRTVEAEILLHVDATRARDAASSALTWFRANGLALRDDTLYLSRARAHLELKQPAAAERDLRDGITGFERRLVALSDPTTRVSAFDAGWDLYRELARIRLDHGDVRGALLQADRGRAQELRRALDDDSNPRDPIEALPTDTALIQYLLFPDRLVIFTVVDGAVTATSVADVARLTRLCWQYSRLMSGHVGVLRHEQVLAELHGMLVRPIESQLTRKRALAIVADGPLHRVSFATLRDRSGRYLGERHVIVASPGLAVFAAQSRPRRERHQARDVLVVGNPTPGESDRDLPSLPGSEREARVIGAVYPNARVLTGAAATRDHILRAISTAEVLHFGGHAIANDAYPALSRLVAAAEHDASGGIFAFELERRRLPALQLAVLAACRTGTAGVARGEGALGIARALLTAKVPSVVATLWDIDDDASTGLFTELHRAVRRGLDGPEAVHVAQLAMLASDNPRHRDPAVWGAVIAAGALGTLSRADSERTQ